MESNKVVDPKAAIAEAINQFPLYFGLAAFPGKVFRFSPVHSYFSDMTYSKLYLYSETLIDGQWYSFVKATPAEFKTQVRELTDSEVEGAR